MCCIVKKSLYAMIISSTLNDDLLLCQYDYSAEQCHLPCDRKLYLITIQSPVLTLYQMTKS